MLELDPRSFNQLLTSHPLLCLSTRSGRTNNVIPLTWYMPASQQPPILAFTLLRSSYSHDLLRESGECAIGVPDLSILKELHYCGTRSGRDFEKMRTVELSTSRAVRVSPLLLSNCLAHIEAEVWDLREVGNRVNYLTHVVHVAADEVAWDGQHWTEEAELVHHEFGHRYRCKGQIIDISESRWTVSR